MDSPKTLVPNIWFNSIVAPDSSQGDCNCNCACSAFPLYVAREGDDYRLLRQSILQQPHVLHYQALDGGLCLACNPVGFGRVAVLNPSAKFLLDCFQMPTSLDHVVNNIIDMPSATIEQSVMQLVRLGLLEREGSGAAVRQWDEPETLSAWLHLTNECNLRCPYCYLHKTPEEMTHDTALRSVDAVFRSAVRHGFRQVKLKYAGGEASLHFGQVLKAHEYAMELAQRHGIVLEAVLLSNGVALSQKMISDLRKRHIKVMISLDGLAEHHDVQRPFVNGQGSFRHVQRTLERLQKGGLTPDISITVSERNLAGLPALVAYVLERELPFSLNYYRENECSAAVADLRYGEAQMIAAMQEVFAVIERNLPQRSLLGCLVDRANLTAPHRHTCGVGHNYLVIDQHGGVAKCQMEIKHTVTTIAVEDPLQFIRDDRQGIQNLSVEEKEGCRTCEWRYWCTGGCSLLTHRATGRYDVKSPNCHIYKSLYPSVLRLEALRLIKHQPPWTPSSDIIRSGSVV